MELNIKQSGFRLVLLFVLAHFSHHLIAALLQPLLPLIRDDFNLDYTQAGWLVSAFTLAYGVSQLPAGWFADRIGARMLITIGISGVAVSGLLAGLSPNYTIMVVLLVAMGTLGGGYHPSAAPLVSAAASEQNRGRTLGLHQIGGTASFFLTPLIAVGLSTLLGSWNWTFISLSILTFVFGVIFYMLLGRLNKTSQSDSKPSASTDTAHSEGGNSKLVAFVILGIALQIATFSVLSFVPLFAVDKLKTTKEVGASLLAIAQFAGLWAGPLGGYLSDRLGKVPVMLAVALAAGPVVYLLNFASPGWSAWLILLALGACQYVGMPVSESYVISHSPQHSRSTILGLYFFASRGGPGLLMPAIGWLADNYSFNTAFLVVGAGMAAVAVVCSLLLLKRS